MENKAKETPVLYSNGCPKCNVLKSKLEQKNIAFELSDDFSSLIGLGYRTAPLLKTNDGILVFTDAVKWVDSQE